jgi:hypothetical protein
MSTSALVSAGNASRTAGASAAARAPVAASRLSCSVAVVGASECEGSRFHASRAPTARCSKDFASEVPSASGATREADLSNTAGAAGWMAERAAASLGGSKGAAAWEIAWEMAGVGMKSA